MELERPARAVLHRTRLPGRALPGLRAIGLGAEWLAGRVPLFHWTDYVFPPVATRTRVVMTLHDCAFAADPAFHGAQAAELAARTRAAIARADAIVCPTQATADDAVALLDAPGSKLRVVPFGADHGPEPAAPPLRGEPYVLMLGTIEPRKNHLNALAAWRALGASRPRLVVVGRPGWNCADAVAALRDAAARERVSWLPIVDEAQRASLVAHARCLLYPSRLEGFGFPVLEALRRGVPVVCGDTPALREVAAQTAVYCDPLDVASIAAAVVAALGDGDAGAAARRRARAAGFRWSAAAAAHAALYHELLAG